MKHTKPVPHRHFCGFEWCDLNVPAKVNPYCGERAGVHNFGTEDLASCRRIDGHSGPHKAYIFGITTPHEWTTA